MYSFVFKFHHCDNGTKFNIHMNSLNTDFYFSKDFSTFDNQTYPTNVFATLAHKH